MSTIDYNGKRFRSTQNSAGGDVNGETVFHYHQDGHVVWADYAGGAVHKGSLIATVDEHGVLDMRYQHVDQHGALKTGVCRSTPEILPNGKLRLHESWRWTCGNDETGRSIIEEI